MSENSDIFSAERGGITKREILNPVGLLAVLDTNAEYIELIYFKVTILGHLLPTKLFYFY